MKTQTVLNEMLKFLLKTMYCIIWYNILYWILISSTQYNIFCQIKFCPSEVGMLPMDTAFTRTSTTFAYTQPLENSLQFLQTQHQNYSNNSTASSLKLLPLPVHHPFCPLTASTTFSCWYLPKALKVEFNFTAMITHCSLYTTKSSCMHQNASTFS